jgi:hypothetical protein
MGDDPIKAAEKRGYAKGYQAGRKRNSTDRERRVIQSRERERRARMDRFMCAAMTGLLAGNAPWQRKGKPDANPDDYALTAHQLAEAMMRRNP